MQQADEERDGRLLPFSLGHPDSGSFASQIAGRKVNLHGARRTDNFPRTPARSDDEWPTKNERNKIKKKQHNFTKTSLFRYSQCDRGIIDELYRPVRRNILLYHILSNRSGKITVIIS